jgi:glucosamine-6-phosphate isomerase
MMGGVDTNLKIYSDYTELSMAAALDIAQQIAKEPDSLLSLAAGETSLGIFEALAELYRAKRVDFSSSFFVAMDEWKDISAETPGSCADFLQKNLFSKVNFKPDHIRLIDGKAADLGAECAAVRQWIEEKGGIEYLLLGVGMNGHLALNEPGVDFSLSVHTTALDEVTREVGKKYFNGANPVLTGGITIGIKDICEAKKVVLSVSGTKKSGILKRIMSEPVTNHIPATVVKQLPQATILCDADAASLLQK